VLGRVDILDLFENRAVLESAAIAALAHGGVVPAAAMDAHRGLMAQGDDFAQYDIAFHRALVAGQPSPRLTHLHGLLMGEIELCIGQVQAAHLIAGTEVARQHQDILDSIVAGDADAAAGLVRRHIEGARDALIAHVERES
jgi:DNA-binding FadR family transcriptional regulator